MSYSQRVSAIGSLVTPEWIAKTASHYFEGTDKLTTEDLITLRSHFISDATRQIFKPDLDNLEKGCAIYLKMRCGKLIKQRIEANDNHSRGPRKH